MKKRDLAALRKIRRMQHAFNDLLHMLIVRYPEFAIADIVS